MRNAALGDCLVRIYEQAGHEVVAVNYFGDEGAHVAKCLWYLQKVYMPLAQAAHAAGRAYNPEDPDSVYPMASIDDIDVVPAAARAEWLGDMYTRAVDLLDLSQHTDMPFPMVIAAKVLSKEAHPDPEAPANWHVCQLDLGEDKTATVVCGGTGYEVGDMVAYLPVGAKLTKKMGIIEPRDMKGVSSCGVMLAERELGMGEPEEDAPKKKGKKAGASASGAASAANKIMVLKADAPAGECLAELGRKPEFEGPSVMAEFNRLKKEAGDVLLKLEHGDAEQTALWRKTGQWSLDEFHSIYDWLDCRFDHDFTESEVSEPSRAIVAKWLDAGFLEHSNGAVVADLTKYNLGKCTLLKSDGAGLYATKDLALAARKFDQFHIDKSIYVVDAAQTYHFQQVFKTLELAGYEQARKCTHIPYGLVVLPSGRMSSRKGNVMLFSQLRTAIMDVMRSKYDTDDATHRRIAVASIKYGMLNHDTSKDIVFELDKWTTNTGNTGPYILYAYSRIMSIFTLRDPSVATNKFNLSSILAALGVDTGSFVNEERLMLDKLFQASADNAFFHAVDFEKYLDHPLERALMLQVHKFWPTIFGAAESNNPSPVCDFVFALAQTFSMWYEKVRLTAVPTEAVPTKLSLLYAVAMVLAQTMKVLGCTVVTKM
jgi:arginyl-tRNA synthetase